MLTYLFRFTNTFGTPTNFVGVAVATNLAQMYWAIDEFGDPWQCEVKSVKSTVAFCVGERKEGWDEPEVSGSFLSMIEDGWRRPQWVIEKEREVKKSIEKRLDRAMRESADKIWTEALSGDKE